MRNFLIYCILVFHCCCTENEILAVNNSYLPCSKEELMKFFPQPIVKGVLMNDAHLPEQEADSIAQELAKADQRLEKMVDEKAARYNPNPLKNLGQRDQAIKIYQETLFEVFASTLKSHNIKDESQIRFLLEEIRSIKSKMFVDCIRQQYDFSPPANLEKNPKS